MELAITISAMVVMLMIFSVFCLSTFYMLSKLQEKHQEVSIKNTPNKFEVDETVPVDQFTPDFSRPISFKVKGYENN